MTKITLKLWQKFLLSLGSIGVVAAAAMGSVYAYALSEASQGPAHFSFESLQIKLEELSKIRQYKMTFRDPVDPSVVIASYKYESDPTDQSNKAPGTVDGKDANQFVEDYYKEHGQPPVMTIIAGGIKFNNYYTEAILPVDFVEFVYWFSQNISWTPGISSISAYTLKKGLVAEGGTLTLGSYENIKGERKEIKFMPDSFFGQVPFGNFFNVQASGLTKHQVYEMLEAINKTNEAATKETEKIFPYSAEKEPDGTYILFTSRVGYETNLAADKMYSAKKDISDINFSVDKNGKITTLPGSMNNVPVRSNIARLAMMRAFAGKDINGKSLWKGIGTNFLKYVTTHEYGHMQTLSMTQDASTNPVELGPSDNTSPKIGKASQAINLDMLNNYLAARIPSLHAKAVSPLLHEDPAKPGEYKYWTYEDAVKDATVNNKSKPNRGDYTNVMFEYTPTGSTTPERIDIDKIFGISGTFGSLTDPTNPHSLLYTNEVFDPKFKANLDQMINNIKAGKSVQFLMRDIKDFDAFADFLKIPSYAIAFLNSNDNLKATSSPARTSTIGGVGTPTGKGLDSTGKWVQDNIFSLMMDDGRTPWFKKVATMDPNKPSIKSPYTGSIYEIDLSDVPTEQAIEYNALRIVLTEQSASIPVLVKLLKLMPKSDAPQAEKDAFMTTCYTLPGGFGAQLKTLAKGKIPKMIQDFYNWFKNSILPQDFYEISGNEEIHKDFDMGLLSTDPMAPWIWSKPTTVTDTTITEFWTALNTIGQVTESKFTDLEYPYDPTKTTAEKLEVIKTFDISTMGNFLDAMEKYSTRRFSGVSPTEAIDVFGGIRAVNAWTTNPGYTFSKVRPMIQELFNLFMPIGIDSQYHFTKQILFDIYKAPKNDKVFIGLDATNNEVRFNFDLDTATLTKLKTEATVAGISAAPATATTDVLKIAYYKEQLTKYMLSKIVKFKANDKFVYAIHDDASKILKFDGGTFKAQPISKLFDLFLLDQSKIEAKDGLTIGSAKNVHFISLKNVDDFVDASSSDDVKNSFKAVTYYLLTKGYKDATMDSTAIVALAKELMKVGSRGYYLVKNVLGTKLYDVAIKNGVFDEVRAKAFLDSLNSGTTGGIKTLSAWQQVLAGESSARILTSGDIVTLDQLTQIVSFRGSQLAEWVANPHEGYVTTLAQSFADYTSLFAEVLTRDWVQMTFSPNGNPTDKNDGFRYMPENTYITEKGTGIEIYVNPDKIVDPNGIIEILMNDDAAKKQDFQMGWAVSQSNLTMKLLEKYGSNQDDDELGGMILDFITSFLTQQEKDMVVQIIKAKLQSGEKLFTAIMEVWTIIGTNQFRQGLIRSAITHLDVSIASIKGSQDSVGVMTDFYMNNGYYKDRWLRDMFNDGSTAASDWKLYDDNGAPVQDTNIKLHSAAYNATTHQVVDAPITNRPEAYWWWLLKTYGVGSRSVAGIFREPERDAMSMWGTLPKDIADKVKFIKATSTTGQVKYIPVKTKDTNNLFYLTKQADRSSKHTLLDDGYKSWVVDLQVLGTWRDANLKNGKWTMEFVDGSKNDVKWVDGTHNAFFLGDPTDTTNPGKGILTEDNKDKSYSPVIMEQTTSGVIMTVKDQFAV